MELSSLVCSKSLAALTSSLRFSSLPSESSGWEALRYSMYPLAVISSFTASARPSPSDVRLTLSMTSQYSPSFVTAALPIPGMLPASRAASIREIPLKDA